MKTKVCTKCKVEKLRTDFSKNKASNDGLRSSCKQCNNMHKDKIDLNIINPIGEIENFNPKIDRNTTNLIDEIENFNSQILELKKIVKDKKEEFINWCQQNSRNIKKLFPQKNKIYQITDIKNAFYHSYSFNNNDYDENEIYYFKPLDTTFKAKQTINLDSALVLSVEGNLLNSSYHKLNKSYMFHDRIKISHIKEIEKTEDPKVIANTFTQIYVMIDKNTGYYKIGRSLSAIKREKTLQSEKPTIELLQTFNGKLIDERNLHTMFKHKRIRGEWFDLSGSDMQSINTYFINKNQLDKTDDEIYLDDLFT